MKLPISFILFYLFTSVCSLAQDVAFFKLSEQELGSNTVYDLHLMDDGSMIAATEHGVAIISMAGVKMLNHPKALRKSYSNIQRDQNNQLYVLNFRNQLYRITPDSLELFLDLTHDFNQRIISYRLIGETVIVYSNRQIKRYYLSTGKVDTSWSQRLEKQTNRFISFTFSGESVGNDSTIYLGNYSIVNDSIHFTKQVNSVSSGARYYQHQKEKYVLRTNLGQLQTSRLKRNLDFNAYFPGNKAQNLGHTQSHFWIGTNTGVLLFDPTLKDTIPELLLKDYSISCVEEDLQGNYWIGTLYNGVLIVPSVNMKDITLSGKKREDFAGIAAIPNTDSIVIATKNGKVFGVDVDNQLNEIATIPVDELYDITYKNKTVYTISTPNIARLKNGSIQTTRTPGISKKTTILAHHILGYSWYSCSLIQKDFTSKNTQNIPAFSSIKTEVRNNALLIQTPFQKLWSRMDGSCIIGSNMGRCKLLNKYGIHYLDSIGGKPFHVADITSDEYNTGYVLTTEGIVYRIDSNSFELHQIGQFDVMALPERLLVKDEHFICYSNGELHYINLRDGIQHRFQDLIPFNYNELVDLECTTESVWLVFPSHLFRIPLSNLKQKREAVINPLQLEDIPLPVNGSYQLSANPGPIKISINYTDVLVKHELNYYYQLNDGPWIPMERINNALTLSNLAAGNYHLKIRIDQGESTINERSLYFNIAPQWYETTWFTILIVLIVFSTTALGFRFQIKAIKKRNAISQKLNMAQLTALKSQMNPHFFFNVLNSIQTMVLKEDKIKANKIMSELSVFVRKILNYSDKAEIPVKDELEMLENYLKLEKHRFNDDFSYQIVVDENLKEFMHYQIPPMMIQPFVENAINHGLLHKKHDRLLSLTLSRNDHQLNCIVEDNGIGRKRAAELQQKSKKYRSFASDANMQRVNLLKDAGHYNAQLQIEDLFHSNQQPAGTRVIISLPLKLTA